MAQLEFLEHVLDSDIADDLLAPPRADESVLVATPSALVGLEFRTVVVAALQDGGWPNLRPRGSLLAPQRLLRVLEGRDAVAIDERKLVLDDELRMFALAVSRASRTRRARRRRQRRRDPQRVLLARAPTAPRRSRRPRSVPLTLRGLTAAAATRAGRRDTIGPDRADAASTTSLGSRPSR